MSNTITAIPAFLSSENGQRLARRLLIAIIAACLLLLAVQVFSADGTEFLDSATKFEGWVKGNGGKTAAFVALLFGAGAAAFTKRWDWLMVALGLALGIGIIIGIINASFTAII